MARRWRSRKACILAGPDGPRRTVQIVIYGHARQQATVRWSLRHTPAAAADRRPPRPRRGAGIAAVSYALWMRRAVAIPPHTLSPASCANPPAMASHPRRITRALLSVSDKTGLIDFARALAELRRRARLHRRHRQGDQGRRPAGDRRLRAHRLSRDDGRPGQDAAPEGAWRAAGDPRATRSTPPPWSSTASSRSISWW